MLENGVVLIDDDARLNLLHLVGCLTGVGEVESDLDQERGSHFVGELVGLRFPGDIGIELEFAGKVFLDSEGDLIELLTRHPVHLALLVVTEGGVDGLCAQEEEGQKRAAQDGNRHHKFDESESSLPTFHLHYPLLVFREGRTLAGAVIDHSGTSTVPARKEKAMTARKRLKNQRQKGFTLIELIVVITIIGILASTVDQAMVAKVKTDFQNVKTAARLFREDHRRWPDSLDELMNPPATPNGMQMSYLENQAFDPWTGEEYYYELTDRGILLISYGADQAEGGDGFDEDIYSDDQNR